MTNFKFKVLIFTLVLLLSMLHGASAFEQNYDDLILTFVNSVKSGDKQEILKFIRFPFKRPYPLSSIDTPEEFLIRFDQVFDNQLIQIISDSTLDDWAVTGWRGIMLHNGILWMDYDGMLLGINYQSEVERQIQLELIDQEREALYSDLRDYLRPILEWETKSYRIRIDYLGDYEYRYAAWPVYKSTNEKPDLILYQGTYKPDGSGGNGYYEFSNGSYQYQLYIFYLGTGYEPPGELSVYKNGELLLREGVIESDD